MSSIFIADVLPPFPKGGIILDYFFAILNIAPLGVGAFVISFKYIGHRPLCHSLVQQNIIEQERNKKGE
jgi:hypothetical protein